MKKVVKEMLREGERLTRASRDGRRVGLVSHLNG